MFILNLDLSFHICCSIFLFILGPCGSLCTLCSLWLDHVGGCAGTFPSSPETHGIVGLFGVYSPYPAPLPTSYLTTGGSHPLGPCIPCSPFVPRKGLALASCRDWLSLRCRCLYGRPGQNIYVCPGCLRIAHTARPPLLHLLVGFGQRCWIFVFTAFPLSHWPHRGRVVRACARGA